MKNNTVRKARKAVKLVVKDAQSSKQGYAKPIFYKHFMSKTRIVLYTVIVGGYDPVPNIKPEKGIEYCLFTDNLQIPAPAPWNKSLLESPLNLSPRRLSRLPKMRPHFYLPPHDISIYMDATIRLRQPIRDFALNCVRELPVALHPHPHRNCTYTEGKKCIHYKNDHESLIRSQLERYRREGFPVNYGLTENSFIVRRNSEEVNRFNDFWLLEYLSGSERDQLSIMYSVWRTKIRPYLIWQNSRKNHFLLRREHSHRLKKIKGETAKTLKLAGQLLDLKDLIQLLPTGIEMGLVNPTTEKSINLFASSGKIKRLWCADCRLGDKSETNERLTNIKSHYPIIANELNYGTDAEVDALPNQSLDFVYIDAPDSYERTKRQIENWRTKIRPGGFIGGQNYSNKYQCVVRAIYEKLGNPDKAFADGTWLVEIKS